MDCNDLIIADHKRARGLFSRWKAAHERDDMESMQLLAAKIVEELLIHMGVEEDVFYPAIRGESEEITETVHEGCEEHHVGKLLVDELAGMEPDGDAWTAKVKVLIEVTEHHIDEEESEMLPAVAAATGADQRESLGARMAARKVQLGGQPIDLALDLTVEELRAKAREQAIPGYSKMRKQELAATVDPRG